MSSHGEPARLERLFELERAWYRGLSVARRQEQEQQRQQQLRQQQQLLVELMTIQVSAYLEAACREIVTAYAARHADPEVARYVEQQMNRFGTPRMDRIVSLVRAFEDGKAKELSALTQGGLATSINALVARRNSVAHGRTPETIGIEAIVRHFRDARQVAMHLEAVLA